MFSKNYNNMQLGSKQAQGKSAASSQLTIQLHSWIFSNGTDLKLGHIISII